MDAWADSGRQQVSLGNEQVMSMKRPGPAALGDKSGVAGPFV